MWAPKGYLPFAEFIPKLIDHSHAFFLQHALPTAIRDTDTPQKSALELAIRGRELLFYWLVDSSLVQGLTAIYLCSPKNEIVRASNLFFASHDTLSYYDFDWPLDRHKDELERPLLERIPFQSHINKDYLFINENFCISAKGKEYSPSFLDEERFNRLRDQIMPFDGWAICLEEPSIESLWQEIESIYTWPTRDVVIAGEPLYSETGARIGRPRKRDKVREVYFTVFPEGHEVLGLTLKQALVAVMAALPGSLSEETLKRAIGRRK